MAAPELAARARTVEARWEGRREESQRLRLVNPEQTMSKERNSPLEQMDWRSTASLLRKAPLQRVQPVVASPRAHGLGNLAVVRPSTGWRHHRPLTGVLLTVQATAVAAVGPDPSTHVKPSRGPGERLLILGSTDHYRPAADPRSVVLPARDPPLEAHRSAARRQLTQYAHDDQAGRLLASQGVLQHAHTQCRSERTTTAAA